MWKFYEGVKDIPNVTVYGDFSTKNRCAIVALNIGEYDSAEVSDELLTEYGISTRPVVIVLHWHTKHLEM